MAAVCLAYNPSVHDSQKYWDTQSTWKKAEVGLPDGFPNSLNSTLAWTGVNLLTEESEWLVDLSPEDVAAIDSAVRTFEANCAELSCISASTFRLPIDLSCRLKQVCNNVYWGRGFQVLRGVDPTKYSPKQNVIMYAGVSAHICPERGFSDVDSQRVIGHVMNVQRAGSGPAAVAPAYSNIPLSFHTDNCEVLSFYYLKMPSEGGRTILSSSWQVYNDLAKTNPQVLHTLAGSWVLDSLKPYSVQPPRYVNFLSKMEAGQYPPLLFRYSRYPILGWQRTRNAELPAPTKAQLEALDAVQFMAEKNSITLPMRTGDMLFVNDMAVFHSREGFIDSGDSVRHLLKMYLRDPEQGWTVPRAVQEEFGRSYGDPSDASWKEIWDIYHVPGLEELALVNG